MTKCVTRGSLSVVTIELSRAFSEPLVPSGQVALTDGRARGAPAGRSGEARLGHPQAGRDFRVPLAKRRGKDDGRGQRVR